MVDTVKNFDTFKSSNLLKVQNNLSLIPINMQESCRNPLGMKGVTSESFVFEFLVLFRRGCHGGIGVNFNATSGSEFSNNFNKVRFHEFIEVFTNELHAIFVKATMLAEAKKIKFETFGFHHFFVGHVVDNNSGKIWLPSLWANGGEFRAMKSCPARVISVLVVKTFEKFGGVLLNIGRGFAA